MSPTSERSRLLAALIFGIAAVVPGAASACPTCYASMGQKVISSYILSAVIMTLLPFTMLGIAAGIFFYLRRQAREIDDARALATGALDPTA